MTLRRGAQLLIPVLLIFGVYIGTLPSGASGTTPPSSASFTAVDFNWEVTGTSQNTAIIAPGGTVSFGYPSGGTKHNVDFGTGPQPTSCAQTAGSGSGTVTNAPLPAVPTGPGWMGSCQFNTPGKYTFHCDMHHFMTGTIIVEANETTTTTTTTTATTATTSSTMTMPMGPPHGGKPRSPIAGTARQAFKVASRQRGDRVRASVHISSAGAGGKVSFRLTTGHTRLGQLTRTRLRAGLLRVRIGLSAKGRRLLHRKQRLSLHVGIVLTPKQGSKLAVTRRLTLLAPKR